MRFLKKWFLSFFVALFLLSLSAPIFADDPTIPVPTPPPILPGELE